MKKNRILLTVLAAVLILGLSIGSALAYFTDWTDVNGNEIVHAGHTGKITDDFDDYDTKTITVQNTSKDIDVFVRVKVFSKYGVLSYTGTNWRQESDYIYYDVVLGPEKSTDPIDTTTPLDIKIDMPDDLEDGDSFNVIVVYEAVPARYHEVDGTPYADWTQQHIETFTEKG